MLCAASASLRARITQSCCFHPSSLRLHQRNQLGNKRIAPLFIAYFFPLSLPTHAAVTNSANKQTSPRSCTLLSTTKSKAVVQSFAVDGAGHEFPVSPGARGGTASSSRQGGGAEAVGTSTSPGPQGSGLGHTGRGRKQEKKKVLEYHKRAMYFHYPYLQMPAFKKKAAN